MTKQALHLFRKYLSLRNLHSNQSRRSRKYLFTGLGFCSAAAALTSFSADADNIVVGSKGVLRFMRSMKIGVTISLDYYFSMFGLSENSPNYDVMMSRIHQRCSERIRDGCLQNGGTYVKLGQGLVSLSHILPREYIDTLKVLQDKCLSREKGELYQVFQEDFDGKTPEELFGTFDTEPIAAASIAQVFQATTKNGQKVAVKVQYNDLQRRLHSDVMTINILLKISAWLHPKVDFTWVLNDFVDALKQELDFVNEGTNAQRCAKDLAHLKYVYIPEVLWKYTKKRVLVTEFVDGIKISEVQRLKDEGFSLVDVNYKLFESFGCQIFQTGFVHADPHPGNVLVRKNKAGNTELIILDHGLYQEIPKNERVALSHLWEAIVFGNHEQMKFFSKILGVDDYTMFAEILTQTPLRTMSFKVKSKLSREEEDYMRKAAAEKFDQIVNCLQQMPRSLLLVVRNLNTIRAISYDHGCPIDRYTVLARMATKAAFDSEKMSFLKRLMKLPKHIWFELNLLINRVVAYWTMVICNLLYKLGLAPDIREIMSQTAKALE